MALLPRSFFMTRRITALLIAFCMVVSLVPSNIARADANQLIVTPTPTQMGVGSELSFSVKAYIDASTSPQTATGTVTFPSGMVQAKNPAANSGWSGSPAINQGQGTITFNMTRNSADTGFSTVFTVTFRAIASGTAVIGFSGDSQVNGTTTAYKSAVISITNPNPAPTPRPSVVPSATPKPSTTPVPIVSTTPIPTASPPTDVEPQPTPDPMGVVDGVTVKPLYNSATISWTVNAANPRSAFSYGTGPSSLEKQGVVQKNADGTFTTTIQGLEPGKRYYFSIAGSGDGNKSGTYSGIVIANGYPVTITVTENNVAVKGAKVKIGTKTYTTSSSGKISVGLAEGNYKASITTDTASTTGDIVVTKKTIPSDGTAPESQSFAFNLSSSPLSQGPGSSTTILTFVGVLLVGTVLLGFGFFAFMAYRRKKFENGGSALQSTSTVIIDDGYDWHQEEVHAKPSIASSAPSVAGPPAQHNNSVYLDEEEPLDMFEQDRQKKTGPPTDQ